MEDFDLPICRVEFNQNIEDFLGIKRILTVKDCLGILDKISNNSYSENLIKQISFIYKQLIVHFEEELNSEDLNLVNEWTNAGKLLASDNNFYPVNNLYYLSKDVNLLPKLNPYLGYITDNIKLEKIENLFSQLGLNKIDYSQIEIKADLHDKSDNLRDLIVERAYYLSV